MTLYSWKGAFSIEFNSENVSRTCFDSKHRFITFLEILIGLICRNHLSPRSRPLYSYFRRDEFEDEDLAFVDDENDELNSLFDSLQAIEDGGFSDEDIRASLQADCTGDEIVSDLT